MFKFETIITTLGIREKLYDFIRIADDKKVKAIYMMLEDEITEEIEWWKNNEFIDELDRRYYAWETGKEKGYTLAEVDSLFEKTKKNHNKK